MIGATLQRRCSKRESALGREWLRMWDTAFLKKKCSRGDIWSLCNGTALKENGLDGKWSRECSCRYVTTLWSMIIEGRILWGH